MSRYRVLSNADKEEQSRWFHECERRKIPYIQVLNRATLAKVEWDYITLPTTLDKLIHDREEELFAQLVEVFTSVADGRSSFSGGAYAGYIDGILIKRAEVVADEIAGLFEQVLSPAA